VLCRDCEDLAGAGGEGPPRSTVAGGEQQDERQDKRAKPENLNPKHFEALQLVKKIYIL